MNDKMQLKIIIIHKRISIKIHKPTPTAVHALQEWSMRWFGDFYGSTDTFNDGKFAIDSSRGLIGVCVCVYFWAFIIEFHKWNEMRYFFHNLKPKKD